MKKVNLIAIATILSAGILAADGNAPATLHDNDVKQSAALSQEFGEGRKSGTSLLALALPIAKSHTVDHQPTYCGPETQKALTYWNKKRQKVEDLRAQAAALRREAEQWNKKVNKKRHAMAKKLGLGSAIGGMLGTLLLALLTTNVVVVVPSMIAFFSVLGFHAVARHEERKANEAWLRQAKARSLEEKALKLQLELEGYYYLSSFSK